MISRPFFTALAAKRITLEPGQQLSLDIPLTIPAEWLTPAPTPACRDNATASISGRVRVNGRFPYENYVSYVSWFLADVPQPIDLGIPPHSVGASPDGTFAIRCLEAGDYFLILGRDTAYVVTPAESVRLTYGGKEFSPPATRVRVAEGQAVTSVEFSIMFPTPPIIIDYLPIATPNTVMLPDSGDGAAWSRSAVPATTGLLLAAAASAAVALLLYALAARLRSRD